MFCKECGVQIEDDSKYCRQCGASQSGQPVPPVADKAGILPLPDIEPAKPASKKKGYLWAGAIVLVLVALASQQKPQSETDLDISATSTAADSALNSALEAANDASPAASSAVTDPWSYSTDEDKVRGATTYYARTTSTNSIFQSSPYDSATTMTMHVRKAPAYGTDVVLTISSGQMMCPSYDGCSGTVRFDDGPAQRINFNGPADHSSDTIFVVGAKAFIGKLKKAKKVIIEKTLYNAGNPQFEFDVRGLRWDH